MLSPNLLSSLPRLDLEEQTRLETTLANVPADRHAQFISIYANRRKDPQTVLLLSLLGFLGFAGVHRFVTGDVVLGIVYFLTGGFCGIATIVDAILHKKIANNHNQRMMNETLVIMNR
ncbi:TM2 domain-containing protein [Neolewinella aurantiaca]|uniref:TM2 domain-containing protein n=1 Tax=Neolewinella aurantiaca TaxID=2602767 RepID=A0A5C7FUX0_9BACT|nr:TM2 domain-containing protein [Neolewinella aurantiaca]TXF90127.1 TM2 domain-containing protein [Neolewinella aurantiaca]